MFIKTILPVLLLISSPVLVANAQGKSQKSTAKSLGYLRAKAGVGPWTLWKSEPLHSRLVALLGPAEFSALRLNMDPAESMTITGGIMSSIGNREHMGTEEEGALIIDLDRDIAEVLILHDSSVVRAWAERNQYIPLPAFILERVHHWPQAPLKQALASLQQAAPTSPGSAPAKSSPTRGAGSGSALDDIESVFGGRQEKAPSPVATSTAPATVNSSVIGRIGQQFDVSGLRIGMPAAQASSTALGIVPQAKPRVIQFSLTDLPGLVMASGANYFQVNGHASQNIVFGFTLSPKLAAVWGIGRQVVYDEDSLPSITATIAALRAKYGAESAYSENTIVHERTLIWLRDASGSPVPHNQAAIVADACAHLGVAPESSQTDIVNGWNNTIPNQIDCSPYSFLNATLVEWEATRRDSNGRLKPSGLLLSLSEQVMSYPLRRANYDATSATVETARRKREADEAQKSRTRSAPL